jgi:Uncharacterised protein family, YAP/Alf4/glomulin
MASAETSKENPFFALRPPTTDPATYLVFIEHNLSLENLPLLHEVLQDAELTRSIGWDLVLMLLPFAPDSEQCLLDVARLGNPREVLLKVTEALRMLELDGMEEPSQDISEDEDAAQESGQASSSTAAQSKPEPPPEFELPIPVRQFTLLIEMLSILHPRIKAKYPSRFLSPTLQAILVAFSKATQCHAELAQEIVAFVKTLTGTKRPHLPKRGSSTNMLATALSASAPDPEAETKGEPISRGEEDMQQRLLQSFLTHVLEDYMLSLHSEEDIPGMALTARFYEKIHPERQIPGKQTYADKFAKKDKLQNRLATVGQIVALTHDLELDSDELFDAIVDVAPEPAGQHGREDDPPDDSNDIPLSKTGSLFLLCARKAGEALYGQQYTETQPIPIFPYHATILANFTGAASRAAIGLEPEALIDSLLFLGLIALHTNDIGGIPPDDDFNDYLQSTSLLSANSPSPNLRFYAHYITTSVLRSHPHDLVRFSFINDTLEHCPYANLKATAVSWLKGETLEANMPPGAGPLPSAASSPSLPPSAAPGADVDEDTPSLFATPIALSKAAPSLFPPLDPLFSSPSGPASSSEPPISISESYVTLHENISFYLASLNFLYLLLRAKHLHGPLDIPSLVETSGVRSRFLSPLEDIARRFEKAVEEGGELFEEVGGEEGAQEARAELKVLEDAVGRCKDGIKALG